MGVWEDYYARLSKAERFDYPLTLIPKEQQGLPVKHERQTPEWLAIGSERIRIEGRLEAGANEHFEKLMNQYNAKKRNQIGDINLKLIFQWIPIDPEMYSTKKQERKQIEKAVVPNTCKGKYAYSSTPGGVHYCGFRKPGYKTCPLRSRAPYSVQSGGISGILVGGSEHICNCRH